MKNWPAWRNDTDLPLILHFILLHLHLHNIIHAQEHVIHYDIDHVIYQKYFFYIYERIKDNILMRNLAKCIWIY